MLTFINPAVILGANGMSSKLSMTRDAYKTLRIWNKKSTPDRVLFLFHIPSKLQFQAGNNNGIRTANLDAVVVINRSKKLSEFQVPNKKIMYAVL